MSARGRPRCSCSAPTPVEAGEPWATRTTCSPPGRHVFMSPRVLAPGGPDTAHAVLAIVHAIGCRPTRTAHEALVRTAGGSPHHVGVGVVVAADAEAGGGGGGGAGGG